MNSAWEDKLERQLAQKVAYLDRMKGELARIQSEMMETLKGSRMILQELQESVESMTPMRWQEITQIVCDAYQVDPKLLMKHDNSARIAIVRHTAQYVLREVLHWSYPEIAKRTGISHHTSVVHGVQKIERMREADAEFDKRLRIIIGKAMHDDNAAICPRCEMAKHTGKCEGASEDITLRADQELERVRAL